MKKFNKISATFLIIMFVTGFVGTNNVYAATTPSLGTASTYGVLGSTYTNTTPGTTINGDVGYTTPPAVNPTVSGTTHVADASYNQAGADQNAALNSLNAQSCDFNFNSATDLSLLPQPLAPGVYCITAAASVGTGGVVLSGAGTYVFRIGGALTTVANSNVSLTAGASACNVFWTPTGATTFGANSSFMGTIIDPAGITIGNAVTWNGRALAYGGTVTSNADTISVPSCTTPVVPVTPTPINGDFTPWSACSVTACGQTGTQTRSCTNPTPSNGGASCSGPLTQSCSTLACPVPVITPVVTPVVVVTPVITPTPSLPTTGFPPQQENNSWNIIVATLMLTALSAFFIARKKI